MSDPEITALREIIAKRARSDDIGQRRRDIDARGKANKLPADVSVDPVSANGVKAEWTATPDADRSKAILYLHGGGYVIGSLDSHRHLAAEVGRAARAKTLAVDYRLAPEHPCVSLPCVQWCAGGWHHNCWRLRRRRSRRCGDAGNPGCRSGATRLWLGHLTLG
jgi:hypothetical protein